jgi:hypothetical protein
VRAPVARVVSGLVALAAIALFAAWIHNASLLDEGLELARPTGQRPSQEEAVRVDGLLRDGSRLDGDGRAELFRASEWAQRGRTRRAVGILRRYLREEPEGIEAWTLLAALTPRLDPATTRLANAQVRRLDPVGARSPRPTR